MRKIPTVYRRSEDRRHVIDAVTPGCEWVFNGEGLATRKFDGTCIWIRSTSHSVDVWARREIKPGGSIPMYFICEERDYETGKMVGWEPAEDTSFAKYITEGIANWVADNPHSIAPPPKTYELCGPKINGNPEGFDKHVIIPHGEELIEFWPSSFDGMRAWLMKQSIEGIVWWHPDTRRAKIKRKDFERIP